MYTKRRPRPFDEADIRKLRRYQAGAALGIAIGTILGSILALLIETDVESDMQLLLVGTFLLVSTSHVAVFKFLVYRISAKALADGKELSADTIVQHSSAGSGLAMGITTFGIASAIYAQQPFLTLLFLPLAIALWLVTQAFISDMAAAKRDSTFDRFLDQRT